MKLNMNPAEYYFDNSVFGWAVKGSDSRYVYANKVFCQYFGITEHQIDRKSVV